MRTIAYDKINKEFYDEVKPSDIPEFLEKSKFLLWTDMSDSTPDNLRVLTEIFKFHPLAIEDSVSKIERPKIDEFKNYLFVVLQIPFRDTESQRLKPGVISLFTGNNYVVTVHDDSYDYTYIDKLFERFKRKKAIDVIDSGALLHRIVDVTIDYCFPILDNVNREIVSMENKILEVLDKESFRKLIILKRDILMFRNIFRPQIIILKSLERKDLKYISDELEVFFGDIVDHAEKIWDLLSTYKEVIEGLYDTHQSLMSNKINNIMKTLTIVSVIMLPLTLIAGIYGMNISLPIQASKYAFIIIMLMMVILSLLMMLFFSKKKWL